MPEWPPAKSKPTPYYFQRTGALTKDLPRSDTAATSFTFDPKNPVPTIGGNISSGDGILLQGAWDQRGGPHVWNWREPIPLSTARKLLARVYLAKGCKVPEHSHHNEQISIIEEGSLKFVIAGEEKVVKAGEVLRIPPHVPHSAEAEEDCVGVDIFSPVREDWIRGDDAYLRK